MHKQANPHSATGASDPPGIGMRINLLCQIALGILAMAACLPSMPYWIDHFGESQARVQLTLAAYLLAFAITQLVYGPLSDAFGRRKILLIGISIGLLGSLAAVFAQSLNALIAARALQGAGLCAGMAVGRAMIQDHFAGAARTRMMAYMGMVMGLCPPGGTLLGGQLHVMFGWRASFIAIVLVTTILLLAAWLGLPADKPARNRRRGPVQMLLSYAELINTRRYVPYCLIAAFSSSAFYVFLGGTPIVLHAYGVSPDRIGWYILFVPATYIVGNLITTRLVGRFSDIRLMWWGQILSAIGVALVVVLAYGAVHHPLAIAMPLMLLGVGHGLLMPGTLAGAVSVVPVLAGAAAAMAGMLQQLTGALGAAVTGYVDLTSALSMALLMMLFTLLAILAQAALGLSGNPVSNEAVGLRQRSDSG